MQDAPTQTWFAASLFFEGRRCGGTDSAENLWEERILLLQAQTAADATASAALWGAEQAHAYRGMSGDWLESSFITVSRVCALDDTPGQGQIEVFSRFLRKAEADSLQAPFAD